MGLWNDVNREARMRGISTTVFVATMFSVSAVASAGHTGFNASSEAIKAVISGKTCVGSNTLRFGTANPDNSGRFERTGQRPAEYHVGEGTIMILRNGALHGHVTSVSVRNRMLYMGLGRYQC